MTSLRPDGRLVTDCDLSRSSLDWAADHLDREWSELTLVIGRRLHTKAQGLSRGRPGLAVQVMPDALWRHGEGWALSSNDGRMIAWSLVRPPKID